MSNKLIVFDSNEQKQVMKNFCPVCKMTIINAFDIESMKKYDCCGECMRTWAEGRKDTWLSGWRPSDDQIATYLQTRRKIPFMMPKF